MVVVLDRDPHLLESPDRVPPDRRRSVHRRLSEVAAFVESLGPLLVPEEEVLGLRADVERVEAHRLHPLEREAQHVARIAGIGLAVGGDDVADHPAGEAVGQDPEGRGIRDRDHVGLFDRVEAGDRRAVEAHPVVERALRLLAAGGWFSVHQSDHLSGGGWEVPGSPSIRVADELDASFPSVTTPAFIVFVRGPHVSPRLAEVRRLVAPDGHVKPGRPLILDGGKAAFLPLGYVGASSNAIDEATMLRRLLVDRQTKVIGEPAIWSNFQSVSKGQLARGELLGFPLILLILLAGFGTLVAAAAPLALGVAAVFLSGAVIYALSRSFEISIYVTNMASMIGIGVAVDYSLFIVSRFRRELHTGATRDDALARALRSSGTAVVFSGLAVAVSLAALFTIDVNALRSMALGAIVVVCLS